MRLPFTPRFFCWNFGNSRENLSEILRRLPWKLVEIVVVAVVIVWSPISSTRGVCDIAHSHASSTDEMVEARKWLMSHTHESVMSHTWMSHVTHIRISHVTHMDESCHTYEWVMSHIWISQVTSAREASWRRVFDPYAPFLLNLYQILEQNLHFGLVPENQFRVSRGRY